VLSATLPVMVTKRSVAVPKLKRPPPLPPAVLPLTVTLVSVSVPLLRIPPPKPATNGSEEALLPLTVLSTSASEPPPVLMMPPPPPNLD
jgi:hypothetical protein